MILTRLGNKRVIADKIIPLFPKHSIYVEPFFGAGGMYFSKRKADYNIVNDYDSEVYNLFTVVSNNCNELEKAFLEFPIHQDLWEYWKKNQETEPVKKALRFLFLSNYGYLGKPETLAFGVDNQKNRFPELLTKTNEMLFNVQFANQDFKDFFKNLSRVKDKDVFIYCDPPYLGTVNNYQSGFCEDDTRQLFKLCVESGHKFMISEFDHPLILELANEYKLNAIDLMNRKNIKNTRLEVLITNYKNHATLFDI